MLAGVGGVLGLIVAYWGIDLLLAVAPESIPRIREVSLDPRVASFGILISGVVGLLFGLAPAMQGARTDLVTHSKKAAAAGRAEPACAVRSWSPRWRCR